MYKRFHQIRVKRSFKNIHSKEIYKQFVDFLNAQSISDIPSKDDFRKNFPEKYYSSGVVVDGKRSNGYKNIEIVYFSYRLHHDPRA